VAEKSDPLKILQYEKQTFSELNKILCAHSSITVSFRSNPHCLQWSNFK